MDWIRWLGAQVESRSFDFPPGSETDFNDSLGAAWFVSPTHHAIELVSLAPLLVALAAFSGWRLFHPTTKAYQLLADTTTPVPPQSWLERILLLTMIASFSITAIHKVLTGTLLFLLQPCHASAVLLIVVMCWPARVYPFIPRLLFNVYLYTLWGAVLALVFPDLRDHDMFGEIFNFFLEHTLVLVLPLYLILTRRYVILPASFSMALFSFFVYAAYHSPVLHVISLASGYNINYVLVPPALSFLIAAGVFYRYVMYLTAFLMMFLARYGIVETFCRCVFALRKGAKAA
ncbi:transmembrane protein [Syncephalastrum racemosum]|uniref:Transmembrane protein n=1 Tax=Syncephalastrum racemosum TaxID=13706 RepID=A0A1X2H3Y4_SYNRA|nr:transmembrane protein [Syncephalastrum racemosum]